MKIFKRVLVIVLLLCFAIFAFMYFGNYSKGTRAGVVMKISKKGTIFKTWEGQMNLETFGAIKAENIVSETFEFSIKRGSDELIEEIRAASLSGERINLNYKEKFIKVFWRGDTKYFATGVERGAAGQDLKEKNGVFPRR